MEHINVQVKTINTIFPTVAKVLIKDEVIGYICENKESNRDKNPQSIILTNGKNFGDFCCIEHAVKALVKHHCGDDGIYVSQKDLFADMGPLGILLAAALLASEGKRPH